MKVQQGGFVSRRLLLLCFALLVEGWGSLRAGAVRLILWN